MRVKKQIFSKNYLHEQSAYSSIRNPALSPLAPRSLNIGYLQRSKVEECVKAHEQRIMAVIQYGATPSLPESLSIPTVSVDLTQLNEEPIVEIWTSPSNVRHLKDGENWFSLNGHMLYGALVFPEIDSMPLEELTYVAYMKVLHCSTALGYPHLLRVWNYFPRINEEQNGLERYKRFCIGRHEAFFEHQNHDQSTAPAGTAIGTSSGPLQLLFLSSKEPGKNFENPRQMSAYDYPCTYGPRNPWFSRATFYRTGTRAQLFIAGTASIVGHASRHFGDPVSQVGETVKNLHMLVQSVEKKERLRPPSGSTSGLLKIHVRHPSHSLEIKTQLIKQAKGSHDVMFLVGDMCRAELLLEIEGILTYET